MFVIEIDRQRCSHCPDHNRDIPVDESHGSVQRWQFVPIVAGCHRAAHPEPLARTEPPIAAVDVARRNSPRKWDRLVVPKTLTRPSMYQALLLS